MSGLPDNTILHKIDANSPIYKWLMVREGPMLRKGEREQNITEPKKWADEKHTEKFCQEAQ